MKLGVLTVPLQNSTVKDTFKYLHSLGVQTVELGAGGYTNSNHLNPAACLADESAIDDIKSLLKKYDLEVSALSCHGNPVHPDKAIADNDHKVFENTCKIAQKLGVDTVVTFSGCPGDSENSKYPNWVTCAWPTDFGKILDWQWNEVLIPYWKKAADIAKSYGVTKIALEMHPGFCVYNTETLLKLRAAVGDIIGANFDPSHLIWQGIDPSVSLKALKGAIFHVHAKDTKINPYNKALNGVLDTKDFGNLNDRTWIFRTIGYGTDLSAWKEFISTLVLIGYDGPVSIEHEDGLMSINEGLEKAIDFLKPLLISGEDREIWWN